MLDEYTSTYGMEMLKVEKLDAVAATDACGVATPLDLTNTLQIKIYQEWQKRDNHWQQRKLKRKGNGVKETPKMHTN